MTKSKQPKASDLDHCVDFIGNMPDPILQLILQGLPNTEEVVRTSILSKQWRYLWTSIPLFPSLNIDCDRLKKMTRPRAKKLKVVLSWALADTTVDLDSFRLSCSSFFDVSTVWQLVNAAVTRKVKRLDLMFYHIGKIIELPHSLLACESLESLRLYLYGLSYKFPDCDSSYALKVLELNNVGSWDDDFSEILPKVCPLLEEFRLINFQFDEIILRIACPKLKILIIHWRKTHIYSIGLVVSCPELVHFECVGLPVKDPFIFKQVNSLKTAVILPQCRFYKQDLWKILARTSHVESLSFDCRIIRDTFDSEGNFPKSLPSLKTLELTTTFEAYDMELLSQIVTCSPNIESIHLIIQEVCYLNGYEKSKYVQTMRILSPYLKRVEFLGFQRDEWKLKIAQLLLEHGSRLEKVVFSWFNEVDYHEKSMVTLNQVSKFHKASSSVELGSVLNTVGDFEVYPKSCPYYV